MEGFDDLIDFGGLEKFDRLIIVLKLEERFIYIIILIIFFKEIKLIIRYVAGIIELRKNKLNIVDYLVPEISHLNDYDIIMIFNEIAQSEYNIKITSNYVIDIKRLDFYNDFGKKN
jgi:hypothetical protein